MSLDTVRHVVETRISNNWTMTPVHWENVHYEPVPGQAYIAPVVLPATGDKASLGLFALNRWTGILDIGIFFPRDTGSKPGNDIADALFELFYNHTESGVTFYTGYVAPTGITEEWNRLTMTIPFRFDELR